MAVTDSNESATVRYARKYYKLLYEHAKDEMVGYTDNDNGVLRVFRGSVTDVFNMTGASQNYLKPVRDLLVAYGCLEIVQRGNRGQPSIAVLRDPLPDPLTPLPATSVIGATPIASDTKILHSEPLRKSPDAATLQSRVEALAAWKATLPENLAAALANIEKRLRKVEAQLDGTEQEPHTENTK